MERKTELEMLIGRLASSQKAGGPREGGIPRATRSRHVSLFCYWDQSSDWEEITRKDPLNNIWLGMREMGRDWGGGGVDSEVMGHGPSCPDTSCLPEA